MRTLRLARFQRLALICSFMLLIGLFATDRLVKQAIQNSIDNKITHILQHNPLLSDIRVESTNAGLLAFITQSYQLNHLSLFFKNPDMIDPLIIQKIILKNPQFQLNKALYGGEIIIQGVELKNLLSHWLDLQHSTEASFTKAVIQNEKFLLADIIFKIKFPHQQLSLRAELYHAPQLLFRYETELSEFSLPEGLLTIDQMQDALKKSTVESSHFEFHMIGNFLEPILTASFPIIQVIAKEMGYYFLKGQLNFEGRFDRAKNHHEAILNWNIQDAFSLLLTSQFKTSPATSNTPHFTIPTTQIVSANLIIQDQGLLKKIFPITKVYLNLSQQDVINLVESLERKQSSPPLKKALKNLIAFTQKPGHQLNLKISPTDPLDIIAALQQLKLQNQHNFEQYQQEMTNVTNDDTRQKVAEYFTLKQDEAFTTLLIKMGFDTNYQ